MKVKVLKTGVTVENAVLDVGAVVDMSEKDATRLSGYGLVEVVDEPEPEPEPEQETLPKISRSLKRLHEQRKQSKGVTVCC